MPPAQTSAAQTLAQSQGTTRRQIQWTRQVRHDRRVSDKAVRLADALAFDFMKNGVAWPSIATLCTCIDSSERALRRALEQLVGLGHLVIESGGGRRRSNHYKWVLWEKNHGENAVVSSPETTAYAEGFREENPSKPRQKRKANSGTFGQKTTAGLPKEPSEKNRLNETEGGSALGRASASPSTSDGFYTDKEDDFDVVDQRDNAALGAPLITPSPTTLVIASNSLPATVRTDEPRSVPVTLADLERLAAEENCSLATSVQNARTGVLPDEDDEGEADPFAAAAARLRALHGATLPDPAVFVDDVICGFGSGDPDADDLDAARRAARTVVKLIPCTLAPDVWEVQWEEHSAIFEWLMLEINGRDRGRTASALTEFRQAVRIAWQRPVSCQLDADEVVKGTREAREGQVAHG